MFKSLIFASFLIFLAGCATVPAPTVKPSINSYQLNGVSYLPLASLCGQEGVLWDYDSVARIVTLRKDDHRVSLRLGEKLVRVDGENRMLSHPVEMYQGLVVVPASFRDKVLGALAKTTSPLPLCTLESSLIRTVVVDAGHGGNDPGAIGRSGLKEKDVNLDIAKRVSKILRDRGITVVITRASDVFKPLEERVRIANNSKSDLFISIHSNANRVRSMKGFEVYYISPAANDLKRAQTAAQGRRLSFEKDCYGRASFDLKTILWDMLYTQNRAESFTLARSLCRTVDRGLNLKVLGIKVANFYVLKGTEMPGVLIEIGFISNQSEERQLKNTFYRQQMSEAICDGVADYRRAYAWGKSR